MFVRSHHIEGFPRLLFTDGILTMSNLKADDRVGIVFCVLLSCLQFEGKQILLTKMDFEQYTWILYVSKLILSYQEWLKLEKFCKRSETTTFNNAQKAVETMANQIIKLMPRNTGNGWDIPKLHELLHIVMNIVLFGAACNVHTGPQEHNHIMNTKKNKQTSSMQKENIRLAIRKSFIRKVYHQYCFQ